MKTINAEFKCKSCGVSFHKSNSEIKKGEGKYCSWSCRTKRTEMECLTCHVKFLVKPSRAAKGEGKYCSRKCFFESIRGVTFPPPPDNCICSVCKKPFRVFESSIAQGKGKVCSSACRSALRQSRVGEAANGWKGGMVARQCSVCSKQMSVFPSQANRYKRFYCSSACRSKQFYRTVMACPICGTEMVLLPWQLKTRKTCSGTCSAVKRISEAKTFDTSIELALATSLAKFGIEYVKQVPVAGVSVADLAIKDTNILIYADGIYWHKRPSSVERGAHQMKVLASSGYIVFRFWEDDIHKDSDGCILRVIDYMNICQ